MTRLVSLSSFPLPHSIMTINQIIPYRPSYALFDQSTMTRYRSPMVQFTLFSSLLIVCCIIFKNFYCSAPVSLLVSVFPLTYIRISPPSPLSATISTSRHALTFVIMLVCALEECSDPLSSSTLPPYSLFPFYSCWSSNVSMGSSESRFLWFEAVTLISFFLYPFPWLAGFNQPFVHVLFIALDFH